MASSQRCRSPLARKYTCFMTLLVAWVTAILVAYRSQAGGIDWMQAGVAAVVLLLAAGAISRFTNRVLARPLYQLEEGIQSVRQGRIEPIQVSPTGDEIQYAAESFNEMIEELRSSREQLREYQHLLEEKIRQRTEALEEATRRAQRASEAKSEFLAGISHELRTPMNGVLGMLDIVLDDGRLDAEQREHLEMARGCAATLLDLLNDLLDLSKIEAGKMAIERIPFDIRSVVSECVTAVLPRARQKGLLLRKEVSGDLPAVLTGDPLRIRQILTNLVGNAVKFTDAGSVDVSASVADAAAGRVWVSLRVADTGRGIEQEKLAEIFEPFSQEDGTISRRYGGTGLGLAITRRLVEMHGGTIRVNSETGKGSTFEVLLPCGVETQAAPPAGLPPAAEKRAAGRILVVEDDPVNRRVVATVLRRAGYEVDAAATGGEGVEAARRSRYDLVLMDLQMPEVDGISAAKKIRESDNGRPVPIVAITAHVMSGVREQCLSAGMNGFLAKPVTPPELLEAVNSFLQRPAGRPPQTAPAGARPAPAGPIQGASSREGRPEMMAGLTQLFLELWPERAGRLRAVAVCGDRPALLSQATKLRRDAERINAAEVARCAEAVCTAGEDFHEVEKRIEELRAEVARLDERLRGAQEPRAA